MGAATDSRVFPTKFVPIDFFLNLILETVEQCQQCQWNGWKAEGLSETMELGTEPDSH